MEDVKYIKLQDEDSNTVNVYSRLSWIQSLEDKVHKLFSGKKKKNTGLPRLPNNIIINILSRLPAQCVLQCRDACRPLRILIETTPSFADMHLNRATPVIALPYNYDHYRSKFYVNFIDEKGKHIRTKQRCSCRFQPVLYCSCNGFLLFYCRPTGHIDIWNPITEQKVSLQPVALAYRPCGFFLHPPTKEYRILYVSKQSEFCVYGLLSKSTRQIGTFTSPTLEKSPVFINGNLHWMVDDKTYHIANNVKPACSVSILVFNIITEAFCTILHPGDDCGTNKRHDQMELMEMEGHLSLCDSRSNTKSLDIWILVDYENNDWVKRHVVDLMPVRTFCGIQDSYGSRVVVKNIYMQKKDQLLLEVPGSGLIIIYNLHLGTIRRVETHKKAGNFVALLHIDSLILDIA